MEQLLLFFTEKAKFLIIAGAVFLLLEYLRPVHLLQKRWRKDSLLDLIYSFCLPIMVYPASVLVSAWLIGNFWPIIFDPAQSDEFHQAITQTPEHGQVEIHPDGSVTYRSHPGFLGIDRFSATTKHAENIITRNFMVTVTPPANGIWDRQTPPVAEIVEVDRQVSGKVTEGFSGIFFRMRQAINGWNLGLQLLLSLFIVDLAAYWRHRLMHTRFFWPFHAIHHSSKNLDWLSNERFHPINTYISYLLSLAVKILFFEDPFVLALCMPLRKAYGMFIHSNIKISYGPLDAIFISPLAHRWHHAANEMADKNYCTFFSFLDKLFGTYYVPGDKKEPASVGLANDDVTNRFWPQMCYPFIKLARMKAR